jgi:hypothetical protein
MPMTPENEKHLFDNLMSEQDKTCVCKKHFHGETFWDDKKKITILLTLNKVGNKWRLLCQLCAFEMVRLAQSQCVHLEKKGTSANKKAEKLEKYNLKQEEFL